MKEKTGYPSDKMKQPKTITFGKEYDYLKDFEKKKKMDEQKKGKKK